MKETESSIKTGSAKLTFNTVESVSDTGIGLDVGTGFLCGAGLVDSKVRYMAIRNAFLKLDNRTAPKILERGNISWVRIDDGYYVVGKDAVELAKLRGSSTQRPLLHGIINPKEKLSNDLLREMINHSIGKFVEAGKKRVVFSIPGPSASDSSFNTIYHSMNIQSICRGFGVEATWINEAYAVSLSELPKGEDTALAFSWGAGLVNVALIFKGLVIFEFSIDKSGDFIDSYSAQAIGESETYMCHVKENGLDLAADEYSVSHEEKALIFGYRYVVQNALSEIGREFIKSDSRVKVIKDVPVILSGGTTMPNGFLELFSEELKRTKLPFGISNITLAKEPLKSVAKGCMIWANSETDSE